MGGLISVTICVLAAIAFYGTDHPILFWLSVLSAVVSFWSWGVMHNYATESAKKRRDVFLDHMRAEGRPENEFSRFESHIISPDHVDVITVPNWPTAVNLASSTLGIVLLIWGAIVRYL